MLAKIIGVLVYWLLMLLMGFTLWPSFVFHAIDREPNTVYPGCRTTIMVLFTLAQYTWIVALCGLATWTLLR